MNNSLEQLPEEESSWLSVSDLMAGLMMVFLFIAIALMRNAFIERDKIKEVAVAYQENQVAIYNALNNEFMDDLTNWDAELDQDSLTFTFKSPDLLFATGKIDLNEKYKAVLNDFFPRYLAVLINGKIIDSEGREKFFKDSINEVRIEGHTSSVWNKNTSPTSAYFLNMALSQGRTRSVLEYLYQLDLVANDQAWIKSHVAAVGLSSSKPRFFEDECNSSDKKIDLNLCNENPGQSRRVSFRVITNAEIQIKQILSGTR